MTLELSSSFQSYPGSKRSIENQRCAICFYRLRGKLEVVSHKGSVHHVFHEKCLRKWADVNPECPICRKKISQIKQSDLELVDAANRFPRGFIRCAVLAYSIPFFVGLLAYFRVPFFDFSHI